MSRLPVPHADKGVYGDVLNDFLGVAHAADGTLKTQTTDFAVDNSHGVVIGDVRLSRTAAKTLNIDGLVKATGGLATITKAGVIVDSDITSTGVAAAVDGLLGVDTSSNTLMYRSGGTWRAAAGGSAQAPSILEFTLDAPAAAGDGSLTLVGGPTSVTGTTYWIVDPFTANAELLAVSSVAGAVLTLGTQALISSRPPEFIASTKTIRLRRPISTIVGNGTTTTVTTAAPHGLITANSVVISGTVNWRDPNSGHLNAVQTGAITVTSSTTFTFASTVNASESVGYAVETGMAYQFALTSIGQALVVTGSSSNNKVVTVASIVSPSEITVTETLTNENSSSVATFTRKLAYAHAAGTTVLRWQGGLIPLEFWGATKGLLSAATANTAAFNRLTRNICQLGAGGSGIKLLGAYYINDQLKVEFSQVIEGTDPLRCGFYAVSPFPFDTTGQVAVIHPQRNGQPVLYEQSGPSGRWWFRRFFVDCGSLANSNAILSSPQQPDATDNIRITNAAGLYGLALQEVQYHDLQKPQFDNCKRPLYLWGCGYVHVFNMNVTSPPAGSTEMVKLTDTTNSSFHGGLFETMPTGGKMFNATGSTSRIGYYDIYTSGFSGGSTGDIFYFNCPNANPSGKAVYMIVNAFCNQNASTINFVNDVQRGITFNTDTDTDRSLVFGWAQDGSSEFVLGGRGVILRDGIPDRGTGSPEGVVTAPVGTLYRRSDGGTGTTLYIKESGSGNTGWVAVAVPSSSGSVLTAPATAAANTITPTADVVNLTLKMKASQTASPLQILDNSGGRILTVTSTSRLGIGLAGDPNYPLDVGGGINATGFNLGGLTAFASSSGWLALATGFNAGSTLTARGYFTRSLNYAPASAQIANALGYFEATAATDEPVVIEAHSAQTADLLAVVSDTKAAILSRFNKAGYFMTRKVAAPADGDLANSELALWLDDSVGATKAMFKAKDSGGTVRTAAVALS